ncbi:MAG: DUF4239 domain-containing protein [Acetobacteraceae bacterium]
MSFALRLAALPLWASAIIVVVVPTMIAMFGPAIVRRTVGLERLATNNEVAGFKFAVLGVVYAVLMGFAVIVVWEKFHDAESAVAQEAGTTATLFRLSAGMSAEGGAAVRQRLAAYIHTAIDDDWPSMARGDQNPAATHAVNELYAAALGEHPADARGVALLSEVFAQLDQLTIARRSRLVLAEGSVPGVVWSVLCVGAVVTVGFTFFFGTPSLRAQGLMTALLAVTVFMGLLVIISINGPFTGSVSVGFEPLLLVLREFGGQT